MKTITLKLYSFNELAKEAKEKALTIYRDINTSFDWWDDEYEDFVTLCSYLGIAVIKDSIKFSGFYSQGDGSGFSAKVDLLKLQDAIQKQSWKSFAPRQEFHFLLPDIDRRVLALIAKNTLPNEPRVISALNYYGVVADLGVYAMGGHTKGHDHIFEELDRLEEWLKGIAETLNCYLYNLLEKQYEFLISDGAVKESILSNEYLFTADGRQANYLNQLTNSKHQK